MATLFRPFLQRRLILGVLGVLIALAYSIPLAEVLRSGQETDFDDAYMFVRYAEQLSAGEGLAWNAGERPIYGPTSIPYVIIVLAALKLPLPGGIALRLSSWLLGALMLALLAWAAAAVTRGKTPWAAALGLGPLLWLALMPSFHYHALSGMDTTLSMLANAALAVSGLWLPAERPARRAAVLALLGYVCFAMRPDNGIYAGGLPLLLLALEERPVRWRAPLLFAAMFGGLLALDAAAKLALFGDALPLSFYAKRSGFYENYQGLALWNPLDYIALFLIVALPWCLLLALGARRRHWPLLAAYLLPLALTFGYYFQVVQIMGLSARYYFPSLPFVAVAGLIALRDFGSAPPPVYGRRLLLGGTSWLCALLLIKTLAAPAYAAVLRARSGPPPPAAGWRYDAPQIGWWPSIQGMAAIMRRLPPGSVAAASEVGYVGASAIDVKLIDLVGLNNREIARQGFRPDLVLGQAPDLIWMPHNHYVPIVRALECSAEFQRRYVYYPGAYEFGVAVRLDSPHAELINRLLAEGLREFDPQFDLAALGRQPARTVGCGA